MPRHRRGSQARAPTPPPSPPPSPPPEPDLSRVPWARVASIRDSAADPHAWLVAIWRAASAFATQASVSSTPGGLPQALHDAAHPLHHHAAWLSHELMWCHAFVAFHDADAALRDATLYLPPPPPSLAKWEVAFSRLSVPAYDIRALGQALRAFRWATSVFRAQELSSAPVAQRRLACERASVALLAAAASAAARTHHLSRHLRAVPPDPADESEDGLPPYFDNISGLLDYDPSRLASALWWTRPSVCSPALPRPCGWLEFPLSGVDLDFVPPRWPQVDFTDAYVSAHVLCSPSQLTICGRHPPAAALAGTSSAVGPGAFPEYYQPACLASLLSAAALMGLDCEDPDDYLVARDICPGPMPSPSHVWSHLMAGITALASRASEASLAEPHLLRDCLGGPRPPDLPLGPVDLPRHSAAWSDGSSDSGGDDSLADEVAAAAFEAGMMD